MKISFRSGSGPGEALYEIILLFAVFFLPGMLPGPLPAADAFDSALYNLRLTSTFLPQILLLVFIVRKNHSDILPSFGLRRPGIRQILTSLPVFAGAFAILLCIGMASSLVPSPVRGALSTFSWKLTRPEMIPMVILSSLVTGYREELFFRSYLLTVLEKHGLGFSAAALAGSSLFAVGHMYEGPVGLIAAFSTGLFFSLVFRRTADIHGIAIGHGLYNIAVLVLSLYLT